MSDNWYREVIEYTTVRYDTLSQVEAAVNSLISEGWEPYGNQYAYRTDNKNLLFFVQPMIKKQTIWV